VITSLEQEVQDLTSERDEAIRSKNEAEQDYLTQIANQDRALKDKVKEFQASNGELLKQIEELKANRGEDHSNPFELESLQLEIKDLKDQLAVYAQGED